MSATLAARASTRGLITLEANNAEARNVLSRSQANGSQVAQLEAALQMLGLVHQNPVSITQTVSSAGRVSSNLAARQSPNAASVARGSSCVTTSALPDRSRTADFHRTSCGRDARGHRCSLHRSPGELRSCYLVTHAQQAMVPVPRMLRISATNVLVIGEVVQLERFVSPSGTPALYGARGSHRNEERLARAGGTAPRARRPKRSTWAKK